MELGMDARSMAKLLEFLQYSFGGGTDVDRPFELALNRLEEAHWSQVRIYVCQGVGQGMERNLHTLLIAAHLFLRQSHHQYICKEDGVIQPNRKLYYGLAFALRSVII